MNKFTLSIFSTLCFFFMGYFQGINNREKNTATLYFYDDQDTGLFTGPLVDNRIIFSLFGQEIWEGPTPEFSLKDEKLFPSYTLPNDLYAMYMNLEYLYKYNFCKEESPCCIYIEKNDDYLGEFPVYP